MTTKTIDSGDSLEIDGVQRIALTQDGDKPADVEITSEESHDNVRIEPGRTVDKDLYGNPVSVTNKSKYTVTVTW